MDNNIIRIINNEMSPRFGHTITLISKAKDHAKAVLFGGATGALSFFLPLEKPIHSQFVTPFYFILYKKKKKNITILIVLESRTLD